MTVTVDEIVAVLQGGRWATREERKLQAAVETVLRERFGDCVVREVVLFEPGEARLRKIGRVDFAVGDVGVELKVKGSRADVLRQAQRYLGSPALEALVVASTHASLLSHWPRELAGKRVVPVHLRSWP